MLAKLKLLFFPLQNNSFNFALSTTMLKGKMFLTCTSQTHTHTRTQRWHRTHKSKMQTQVKDCFFIFIIDVALGHEWTFEKVYA